MEPINLQAVSSDSSMHNHSDIPERAVILVIDDELGPRESLKMVFKDQYTVLLASNGDEGIELLKRNWVDVVVLDLHMPGKDGLETFEEIRAINSEVLVVILTGYGTLEAAQKAVHHTVHEFLSKPFDVNEMKHIVESAVQKRRMQIAAKNLTARLAELNEMLQKKSQQMESKAMVGELSLELLHEINNPLTVIGGYIQLLLKDIHRKSAVNPDDARKYLSLVENEVKRCQTIAKSFLDISRGGVNREKIDLNKFVENLSSFFSQSATAESIKFSFDLAEEPICIFGEPNQLQQVFLNLILNGIEAVGNSGTITVSTSREGESAVLKISDTGTGIPQEMLEKIFEPFFTTKPGKGAGLGLAITKKIVEAHKGQIKVESEAGKGTIFTLAFPAV